MTEAELPPEPQVADTSTRRLAGATAGMAVGTLLSRLTGVGRIIALAAALGGGAFADGYNLANTTPNIIYDLILGGVLSATFVPVFVDRLTSRPAREAWDAISAVVTATVALLLGATVVFFFLAPWIIDLYTVTNHHADVHQQQAVAVFLLRWFVPQIACYGLIAVMTALLNARSKFAAPMYVPIANNLVVIAVLVWFHELVPHPSLHSVTSAHSALIVLGFGTTLGVIVQAALLVPSLVRARPHLRFIWSPRHEAMRRILHLAGWTFGWVVANQLALVVILALADGAREPGAVTAYTYAYTFFQLPYGVVAVSVMTAVTPSLAARWVRIDLRGFRRRMGIGLRGMLAIVVPSAAGMLVLARPLINLVLLHVNETSANANAIAGALAMFSLGLPGFCTFLYCVRVFQAMQDTRTAFKLYLVENGINVVLAVALVGPLGVRGLALSLSIAYTVAAVLALAVIRDRVGGLGGSTLADPLRRIVAGSLVLAVAAGLAVNVSGAESTFWLFVRVVLAVVVGAAAYVGTVAVLGARDERRRPPGGGDRGSSPPHPPPAPPPHPPSGPPPDAAPDAAPPDGRPAPPIHDRLGDRFPYRHLRPVPGPPDDDVDEEDGRGPHPGGDGQRL